jgi:hypothetical protein
VDYLRLHRGCRKDASKFSVSNASHCRRLLSRGLPPARPGDPSLAPRRAAARGGRLKIMILVVLVVTVRAGLRARTV